MRGKEEIVGPVENRDTNPKIAGIGKKERRGKMVEQMVKMARDLGKP